MTQKPPNPDTPAALIETPGGYADWLAELKLHIHTTQQLTACQFLTFYPVLRLFSPSNWSLVQSILAQAATKNIVKII